MLFLQTIIPQPSKNDSIHVRSRKGSIITSILKDLAPESSELNDNRSNFSIDLRSDS